MPNEPQLIVKKARMGGELIDVFQLNLSLAPLQDGGDDDGD